MPRLIPLLMLLLAVFSAFGCGGSGSSGRPPDGVRWKLTPAGGTFSEGNLRLTLPAGAVSSNKTVTVNPLTPAPTPPTGAAYVAGSGWTFTPATFANPATLRIGFAAGAVPDSGLASLKIYRRADGATTWTPLTTTVDAEARTATASIDGFSSYALFYTAGTGWNWTSVGGAFTFEGLSVTLPADAVTTPVEVQPRRTPTPFPAPDGWTYVPNTSYDLGSSNPDLETDPAFTVALTYAAADVPAEKRGAVKIWTKENDVAPWVELTTTADVAGLRATAPSPMLGTFALFVPAPGPVGGAFYVEQESIPQSNDSLVKVYAATAAGEQFLYSVPRNANARPVLNSYREDDQSFLDFDHEGASWHLVLVNAATGVRTRIHTYTPDANWTPFVIDGARSVRYGNPRDAMIWVQERNAAGTEERERLIRFRTGETPLQLTSATHPAGGPVTVMHGMDITPSGDVIAWTDMGLVVFEATTPRTLAPFDMFPQDAQISPSGAKVLFRQVGGEGAGWKLVNFTGGSITAVPGTAFLDTVGWGADDDHLIVGTFEARTIKRLDLTTGTLTTLITPPTRTNSRITQVGAR